MAYTIKTVSANRFWISLLAFFMGIVIGTQAGASSAVHLQDGSVVIGEVVGCKDGVYTIETDNLGTITVDQSRIKSIKIQSSTDESEPADSEAAASGMKVDPAQIQSMQESLMADQEIMRIIQSLQSDPNVQALINDPEIVEAINSGDIGTLLSNPKFMNLLNNPKIQEINQKVVE